MLNFLLFIIAYVLYLPLSLLNFFYVRHKKGYFRSSALNLDIFANREFRTLWNKVLITDEGYQFGVIGETISSALGKNELKVTLKRTGRVLVKILNFLDKNHCFNSIQNDNSLFI